MKMPKSLKMFGYNWRVKTNNKAGGAFNWEKNNKPARELMVGKKYGEQEMVLLHEIIESVMLHHFVRYYGNEGNQEYMFIFNHTKYSVIIKDIYQILKTNKLI